MLALEWKGRAFIEKVNSRCFCWFPAAILVDSFCPPIWRLHTKLYKGAWNVSANNSETVGHKDLRFRQIVYTLVFYNTSFSWLFPLDGFNLFFGAVFIAWPWKTKNTTQFVPRQWRNVPTDEEQRLYSTLDAACEVSPFLLMRIVRGEKMEVNGRGGEGEGSLWRRRDRKTVWHLSFHTLLCCTKSYLASYWSIIKVSHDITVINNAAQADTYRS